MPVCEPIDMEGKRNLNQHHPCNRQKVHDDHGDRQQAKQNKGSPKVNIKKPMNEEIEREGAEDVTWICSIGEYGIIDSELMEDGQNGGQRKAEKWHNYSRKGVDFFAGIDTHH